MPQACPLALLQLVKSSIVHSELSLIGFSLPMVSSLTSLPCTLCGRHYHTHPPFMLEKLVLGDVPERRIVIGFTYVPSIAV